MPEGDSVYRTAWELRRALAGQVLTVAELRVPAHATADLVGREVLDVVPRGKHLLTRIEGGLTLHTHLRMEGRWRVFAAGEPWSGGQPFQIRAVLGNVERTAVGYRLGVVELLPTAQEARAVGHLGPDLLGPDWDEAEAVRRVSATPGRTLCEALLDQRNLAGIGNVYANELCFLAQVSPWTPVAQVGELPRVVHAARQLLLVNKLRHGHVTTGDPGPDRQHWVYGRAHRPCRRCGAAVRTARLGLPPQDRVVFWCPRCQPGPAPAGRGR
ncbi:DNA-formamidopyrimidine glycosylase family protein [Streptacidiphilus jiangxiensis]|uniref:DNA-(apurinic or apyrimidinic site) lyase n=1 Tax=Streptacidiphilus jiangxiensis TaxID=235985 RepID=A0A1H7QLK0_STRJI|nr:DNA-formamidopyrimidine glycosylase family protein [Streptacidiphilus jiangxiensis]SEL48628.1 endonuclease-8 [Streptacidiphilus jiangxiensis]